jgi:hypothetical protein
VPQHDVQVSTSVVLCPRESAPTRESQPTHPTQQVLGSALSTLVPSAARGVACSWAATVPPRRRATFLVTHGRWHSHAANDRARPPLAHVERRTHVSDSVSLGSGRHHFFPRRSLSAASSSMASARSFLRLAFSLSSQPLRLGDLEPTVLGLPVVEARLADPVLTAQIDSLQPGLVLQSQ